MRPPVARSPLATIVVFLLLTATGVRAQEWMCDASLQDCRAPLLNLIRAERTGIDVAFVVMTDPQYADEIIRRWTAGVPVRVLVDTRDDAAAPAQEGILQRLLDAGIPVRNRVAGGSLQWTLMLFAGQRVVQVGGGGYTTRAFVPVQPYTDHGGGVVAFLDDPVLVDSFMTQYDEEWTSPAYADRGGTGESPARRYPAFAVAPELTFSSGLGGSEGR
jgi:hypothetical protein